MSKPFEKSDRPISGDGALSSLGIYVHIPFCVRKCLYCDFFSGPAAEEAKRAYVEDLIREISETPFGNDSGERVTSVFFGGGTPSLLPGEDIGRVLGALRKEFLFSGDPEITVECNPGTLSKEKLERYRAAGVNRLSIGLQSVRDETLQRIGRIHTFREFLDSYELARKTGFRNINVDLISGLPGETPEDFENGLKTVLELRPEHLSVYALILEENTPFYTLYGQGKLILPDEETERRMYRRAREILAAAGYGQYEISNFALPGYRCRQNEGYWTHVPYLGFGSAAASFYGGRRFRNALSLQYLSRPYDETEILTEEDLKKEFLMLGLRRTEGVKDRDFRERFGESFLSFKGEEIRRLLSEGLLSGSGNGDGYTVALTERGLDLANVVFRELI